MIFERETGLEPATLNRVNNVFDRILLCFSSIQNVSLDFYFSIRVILLCFLIEKSKLQTSFGNMVKLDKIN